MNQSATPSKVFEAARQAFAMGDHQRVAQLCQQLLRQVGPRADVLNLQGLALLNLGQTEAAAASLGQAVKREPARAELRLNAALAFEQLCDFRQAKRQALEAARLAPRAAPILYQAARTLRQCGDHARALRLVERLLQANPDHADAWHLKGSLHMDLGEFQPAEAAMERVVALEPLHARALSTLAELRRDTLENSATATMLEQVCATAPAPADRAAALFTLAGLAHRGGHHDEAFERYRQANALMAQSRPFDIDAWERSQQASLEDPDASRLATAGGGSRGANLVFVVGMPRSGTTLCEQALGAHPEVMACGEMQTMRVLDAGMRNRGIVLAKDLLGLEAKTLQAMAAHYLASLPAGHESFGRLVDKATMNFERIGFIHTLFPGARFVWMRRQALDTILSCWFQNFQAGLNWSFDLACTARVYVMHLRLMEQWRRLFPARILAVRYEELVDDLPGQAHALAEFLELDFHPAMLEPHRNPGKVMTASIQQVRKPVYRSSIDRWRPYRRHLQAVIRQLGAAGVPLPEDVAGSG